MTEQSYQSKIIKAIESRGGHVVNGIYTRNGEADLQCGYPIVTMLGNCTTLHYLAVEVKTEKDWHRVMKCLKMITVDGVEQYQIQQGIKGLKPHEPLQITKINNVRKKGGLAIIAYSFEQVEQYIKETT